MTADCVTACTGAMDDSELIARNQYMDTPKVRYKTTKTTALKFITVPRMRKAWRPWESLQRDSNGTNNRANTRPAVAKGVLTLLYFSVACLHTGESLFWQSTPPAKKDCSRNGSAVDWIPSDIEPNKKTTFATHQKLDGTAGDSKLTP